jgi:hypothetical protein
MTELQVLTKFKNDAAKLSLYISRKFASLTPEQINFRPIADKWSVGECFEHLIISHRLYYDKLSAIIEKNNLKVRKEDKEVFNSFFGKKIISAVKPDSNKKIKTSKIFKPLSSELNDEVFERFILLQNKFVRLCYRLQDADLSKIKLSSPVSKIIRLNAADVLIIIIHHNNRHIHQAAQIVDLCFFPKEPHKNGNSKK